MADTKDEVKPRDSFSFWNEKAKQPHSPPSLSPRENDQGPKSMPSGQITDRVKLIEQALAKPKFGLAPASSPPPAPSKDKKDKKSIKDDEEDKEPVRKGSRTAQTPTIGKRDLTSSAGPSPTAARNGAVPIVPNIVSSPMFDKKIKSAAQANKTLTSPHRVPEDENDFGTSSLPGTPSSEKADSPATARKTLSSDSPRLKKLIRVKSMGSPMDSPLVTKKDRTEQLVLGEYSIKNSVSEPVLSNPSSEGGSLSDEESSAEDIELVDDNASNASSQPEEGRRESVVSDDGNLPTDIDLAAEGEQDPEKLQMLQEKISLLQDEAEKLNSLINDLKIPLSDLEGDPSALEDTKSKIAEKEGELKKLTEQLGELMQEKGLKKKKSTRTLSRSGSFTNSKKKKRSTLKRSKSGHLSDGKIKRTSSKKRVRDLVTEVEGDKKIVKGGSIVELVNAFAKKDIKDFDYVESFILTHQTFMTSDQLVDLLIEKYKSAPEEKDNSSSARSALETMDSSTDSNTPPVPKRKSKYSRRRILNLIRMWIVKCPQDFIKFNNVPFFDKVRTFMSNSFEETRSPIAQDALDILDGKKDLTLPSAEMVFSPTKPISSKGSKPGALPEFMEWNEKEVAKQLTMWTHELFKKIKPSECFGKGWSKGEEYANEKAPNIWQMIQRFNQVSTWVATEIVKQDALKQRVKVVKKLLLIAQHCRELNNFETAMAFVSGFQTTAVDRLKDTWRKIEAKPKLWATFQDLVKLFDSEGNFQEYRNAMKGISNSPAIPYLGLSLRLLTYIEDGNENDFGKKLNRKDLINFDKRRKLAHVVADIIKWQNTSYAIEKDTTMIKYLESAETFNETLLWKQSQICEARKGKSPSMDN